MAINFYHLCKMAYVKKSFTIGVLAKLGGRKILSNFLLGATSLQAIVKFGFTFTKSIVSYIIL